MYRPGQNNTRPPRLEKNRLVKIQVVVLKRFLMSQGIKNFTRLPAAIFCIPDTPKLFMRAVYERGREKIKMIT